MLKEEVKNTFWDSIILIAGKITLFVLALLSISITARILGVEGYGKLALFLATVQLFFTIGIAWVSSTAMRYGIEEYAQSKKINKTFWSRLLVLLPAMFLTFITILIFQKKIFLYLKISDLNISLFMLFLISLVISTEVQAYLRALHRIKLYGVMHALERIVICLGLLLIWCKFIPARLTAVISVYTIGSLSISLALFFFLIAKYIFPIQISGVYFKRILFYCLPLLFGFINTYAFNWIDVLVIKRFMTVGDVGIYSLAYNGMSILQQFPMMATAITIPLLVSFLTKQRIDLIARYIARVIPQVLFLWVILLSLAIMAARFIIPLLGGEHFNQAIVPFSGLLIGLIASGYGLLYAPVISAYEMTKHLTFIAFVSTSLNILGNFILIPKIGILGAVVATSLSFLVDAVLRNIVIHKRLGLKVDFNIFIFLLPAFIALYFFNVRPCGVNFTWGILLFIISLFLIILKFKLFSREDMEILKHINMPVLIRQGAEKFYLAVDNLYSKEKVWR